MSNFRQYVKPYLKGRVANIENALEKNYQGKASHTIANMGKNNRIYTGVYYIYLWIETVLVSISKIITYMNNEIKLDNVDITCVKCFLIKCE